MPDDFFAMVDKEVFTSELATLARLGWPVLVTFLLGMGMKLVDVWFLGKLGPQVMAASSLGGLYIMVGGLALGNGLLTAIDTLVSQAFTGARHQRTLGIILQRAILIIGLLGIPVGILWANAKEILIWMGQDAELADMASTYIALGLPVMYPMFLSTAFRRFLQSVDKMQVTMVMIVILFPLNAVSDWVFLSWMDLGVVGAGLQMMVFHGMWISMYLVYMCFFYPGVTDPQQSVWPGWQWGEATSQWSTFLKLGVPGMLSISTDWAFEVCALVTGVLGEISLAAQSVVLSVNSFLLMIPFALATTLSVRLGHHLGANEPKKAKQCVALAVVIGFCLTSLNAMVLFGFRQPIAFHFSTDALVIDAVTDLMHVVSPCHFLMGIGVILSSVLNSFGKQYIVASVNLASYYLIGLPFGIWLTFRHGYGLSGVWCGVVVAGLIKVVVEAWILMFKTDWQVECERALRRIHFQEHLPL
ncbi:MATE efflux family protein [Hesseltinella vesiculosa]|uniref:MATE efflux family protein n=1 Tax=Hesseltinella vesiculosa TaxID=101127 RepID=A0A1X2GI66_9FUNG|nr:MATE efflux family protein [Hesseltinella vesiculosa]